MPELLTPKEAAAELGVTAKTISNWCRKGKLAHIRTPSGHRRILKTEVDRLKAVR
jgi:excisionase family DNA binding protein